MKHKLFSELTWGKKNVHNFRSVFPDGDGFLGSGRLLRNQEEQSFA